MEERNYLITLKPKNELLKKQIAYYYFHVSDNENHSESFYFYPNYLHALTIYKGNETAVNPTGAIIRPSANKEKFTFLYTINFREKAHVDIQGSFHKIGVVFYPLGFNHFIQKPLNEMMLQNVQEVVLQEDFKRILSTISANTSIEEQIEILENALLSIYTPFQEKNLQHAIKEIILSNGTAKTDELEQLTLVSRKTLLRLFKKHTLVTIEEYKKMVMFRHSLNYALQQKDQVNLTDIALYNMYYDQSHFIKHFKSFTKETPKTLLPKIKQIGDEELYWHFLEN
ncbi:MAG TPA: helix-turn-helix domain-containing protein [Flavobacterium sp.]|nr:helix-turn-helix domain-containing protein [Flavobacterium sp.]